MDDGGRTNSNWLDAGFTQCKCCKVCKVPECHSAVNALRCSPACKNQLCDNIIDDDFENSVDDTED